MMECGMGLGKTNTPLNVPCACAVFPLGIDDVSDFYSPETGFNEKRVQ